MLFLEQNEKDAYVSFTGTPRPKCQMTKNTTYLYTNSCKSVEPVEITACEGSCGASSSMQVSEGYTVQTTCSHLFSFNVKSNVKNKMLAFTGQPLTDTGLSETVFFSQVLCGEQQFDALMLMLSRNGHH